MAEKLFPNYKRNLIKGCVRSSVFSGLILAVCSFTIFGDIPLLALGCTLLGPALIILVCWSRVKRAKPVVIDFERCTATLGEYGTKPLQRLVWAEVKRRSTVNRPNRRELTIQVGFSPEQRATFVFGPTTSPLSDADIDQFNRTVQESGIDEAVLLI